MDKNIESRIIQLTRERKLLSKTNKSISIYPYVATKILNEYGIHIDSEKIRDICRRYRERNSLDEYFQTKITQKDKEMHNDYNDKDFEQDMKSGYKESVELNKDGTQTSDKLLNMSAEEAKDVNFILKAHGYDILSWELVSARNNIWNVYSKQDGIQTLYSSKIVVKPVSEYVWNEDDIKKLFTGLKTEYKNKVNIQPSQYSQNGNILVVPIADFHYNLISDKFSNGNDYNLEIAEDFYYYVLEDTIQRYSNRKFEKVLFVVGNDFINADNLSGTTTKGTPQDNAGIWFDVVKRATQLIVNGIDKLSHIAPVDVLYVPSNHDLHTMFGIMQTLQAWYRNDKNINIDDSPLPRKYYKFGKTLIALSHDIKVKEALRIISTEAKNEWSDCEHIICLLAHLHQAMVYEKQGYLEVMRLPTISGWSRWTNTSGYVQSDRKNQEFIINGDLGITDTANTIIL